MGCKVISRRPVFLIIGIIRTDLSGGPQAIEWLHSLRRASPGTTRSPARARLAGGGLIHTRAFDFCKELQRAIQRMVALKRSSRRFLLWKVTAWCVKP